MLERCDIAPFELVGVSVEVVVTERLQPGQHGVDFGLLRDEGGEGGFAVPPGLLGAKLVARGGDGVQAGGHLGCVPR